MHIHNFYTPLGGHVSLVQALIAMQANVQTLTSVFTPVRHLGGAPGAESITSTKTVAAALLLRLKTALVATAYGNLTFSDRGKAALQMAEARGFADVVALLSQHGGWLAAR